MLYHRMYFIYKPQKIMFNTILNNIAVNQMPKLKMPLSENS